MKKLILLPILIISLNAKSQQIIDVVKLSDGRYIEVFDDYTWKYQPGKTNKPASNEAPTNPSQLTLKSKTTPKHSVRKSSNNTYKYTTSSYCGARTKSGGYCRRKVAGGGRCWQH